MGSDWSDFVSTWFAGRPPMIDGDLAWQALRTLQRLWPEHLDGDLKEGAVHPQTVARLIDDGVALAACEQFVGFESALARVRQDERGAASELRWAATLAELGYEVTLEPGVAGRHPDASISPGGEDIFFEVTTPEYSEAIKEVWSATTELALRMAKLEPPSVVHAYLTAEPGPEVTETVIDFLRGLNRDAFGATHYLPDVGYLRCNEANVEQADFDPAPNSWMYAEVASVAGTPKGNQANVRTRVTDDRAEKLMHEELAHFSNEHPNVLVMDVSRVPRGIARWAPLIERRFQPEINRRCGAVMLLDIWTVSPPAAVRLRSRLLRNPHACKPVPAEIVEQLRSLPNWWEPRPTTPSRT